MTKSDFLHFKYCLRYVIKMNLICYLFHYRNIVQVTRKIHNTEFGFYYDLLHKDIDMLNLQIVLLMGKLFELPKKIHKTKSGFYYVILHKDIDMLNLDFLCVTQRYWYSDSAVLFINGNIVQDMPEILDVLQKEIDM